MGENKTTVTTLTFRQFLRQQLDSLPLSTSGLASELNTAPATVSRWLSGETQPSRTMAIRLASVLRLDPDGVLDVAGYPRLTRGDELDALRLEIQELEDERVELRVKATVTRGKLRKLRGELAQLEEERADQLRFERRGKLARVIVESLRPFVDHSLPDAAVRAISKTLARSEKLGEMSFTPEWMPNSTATTSSVQGDTAPSRNGPGNGQST